MTLNPSREILRKEESEGRVRWLADDERAAMLESCEEAKCDGLYPLVLLALATGARQGELIGLKWDQIDPKAGRTRFHSQQREHIQGLSES